MDTETTIAQGVHIADENAAYDAACKRVLSEKAILARIMKVCLSEYQDCDVNDIAETYIEGQPQVSSVPVLPDEDGTIINGVDSQDKSLHEECCCLGYPLTKGSIYYCSRMISSQYGRKFTGPHYEKLKKVYSIWIWMKPPKFRKNSITRYRLIEEPIVDEDTEAV